MYENTLRSHAVQQHDALLTFTSQRGMPIDDGLRSFKDFVEKVGLPPTEKHQLQLLSFADGFTPGNLIWYDSHEVDTELARLELQTGITHL